MSETTYGPPMPSALARAENLPSLPAVTAEILRLAEDENTRIDDLAAAISRDPELAAKMLRLANSPLFNPGHEVTGLDKATLVLGLGTVKLMSLCFSLATSAPMRGKSGRFDFGLYWHRCLVAAVAGRSLCQLLGSPHADEAFMSGLLSHLGQLVIARCLPEEYDRVIEAGAGRWPSVALEEKELGFHSADVGSALLRQWQLPELLHQTVGYMSRPTELPENASEDVRELVHVMKLASIAVDVLCEQEKGWAFKSLLQWAKTCFGMHPRQVEAFLIGLEPGVSMAAEMLDVELPDGLNHQEVVDDARLQIVQISLGNTVALHAAERRSHPVEGRMRPLALGANTDELTGLSDGAAFDQTLVDLLRERADKRVPLSLGLLVLDVDRFEEIRAGYGAPIADKVLQVLGHILKNFLRSSDVAARVGTERFAVIAPQTTPPGLRSMAERVRRFMEAQVLDFDGEVLRITVSIGGACITHVSEPEGDAQVLVGVASDLLEQARQRGPSTAEISPDLCVVRKLRPPEA